MADVAATQTYAVRHAAIVGSQYTNSSGVSGTYAQVPQGGRAGQFLQP